MAKKVKLSPRTSRQVIAVRVLKPPNFSLPHDGNEEIKSGEVPVRGPDDQGILQYGLNFFRRIPCPWAITGAYAVDHEHHRPLLLLVSYGARTMWKFIQHSLAY